MVAVAANASVFGPSDVALGHGEVGGYLQGFSREGKIVGGIAVGILKWGEAGSYPDSGIGFDIRELGKKEGLGHPQHERTRILVWRSIRDSF
jgi:hypothetical protein